MTGETGSMKPAGRRGFTLIEMLVVIVIIGILVGLLLSALYGVKKNAKLRKTSAEISALVEAVRQYHFQERRWPCPESAAGGPGLGGPDWTYDEDNLVLVLAYLRGLTPPLLDLSEFRTNRLYRPGDPVESPSGPNCVLDPWGVQYRVRLDTDYDDVPMDGVMVWSAGPDRVFDTGDDIRK